MYNGQRCELSWKHPNLNSLTVASFQYKWHDQVNTVVIIRYNTALNTSQFSIWLHSLLLNQVPIRIQHLCAETNFGFTTAALGDRIK